MADVPVGAAPEVGDELAEAGDELAEAGDELAEAAGADGLAGAGDGLAGAGDELVEAEAGAGADGLAGAGGGGDVSGMRITWSAAMSALRSAGSSPSPTFAFPFADLAWTCRWPRLVPAARWTAGAVDAALVPSCFSSTASGLASLSGFFSASADATSVAMAVS